MDRKRFGFVKSLNDGFNQAGMVLAIAILLKRQNCTIRCMDSLKMDGSLSLSVSGRRMRSIDRLLQRAEEMEWKRNAFSVSTAIRHLDSHMETRASPVDAADFSV